MIYSYTYVNIRNKNIKIYILLNWLLFKYIIQKNNKNIKNILFN